VDWIRPVAAAHQAGDKRYDGKLMKTPQEKKRLSYQRDRRNSYGENSKASRKNIPLSKALSIRAERHSQDHLLLATLNATNDEQLALVENSVRSTKPRQWRKSADEPLGEALSRRHLRKSATGR
jgi:hypothetical protein